MNDIKVGDIVRVKSFNDSMAINRGKLEAGSNLVAIFPEYHHFCFKVFLTNEKFPSQENPPSIYNDTMLKCLSLEDLFVFINRDNLQVVDKVFTCPVCGR